MVMQVKLVTTALMMAGMCLGPVLKLGVGDLATACPPVVIGIWLVMIKKEVVLVSCATATEVSSVQPLPKVNRKRESYLMHILCCISHVYTHVGIVCIIR